MEGEVGQHTQCVLALVDVVPATERDSAVQRSAAQCSAEQRSSAAAQCRAAAQTQSTAEQRSAEQLKDRDVRVREFDQLRLGGLVRGLPRSDVVT